MRKYFVWCLVAWMLLPMFGRAMAANADETDGWVLAASESDKLTYVGAPVAGGGIGILPWKEPFSVRHVVLNHVFDACPTDGVSAVLAGINPFGIEMRMGGRKVTESDVSGWEQRLNMREATHATAFTAFGVKADYTIAALRGMPYAGLMTIQLEAVDDEVLIELRQAAEVPDGQYVAPEKRCRRVAMAGKWVPVMRVAARSAFRGRQVSASAAFLYDREDNRFAEVYQDDTATVSIRLKRGEQCSLALMGAVVSDRDFIDPCNESDRQVIFALMEGADSLMKTHRALWRELWQGDIRIEGDPEAQRVVRFALYNLYSYIRAESRLSISPMGLSARGYNGHVFWDTEMWMYPPLLFLNEGMARSMMDYRTDRLPAARRKAQAYGFGGAMFPWESDDAGEESCPTWALTGPFEHHITADIAIAAWHYYCATRDLDWLRTEGWPLIKASADFWTTRATANVDGSYSIRNVVCADEYAEGVDDNAFTNGAVIRAMEAAVKSARLCGFKADPRWESMAQGLCIPRMSNGVTAEYAGYDGRMIKQADVNLLGYPLGLITDEEQLRRDLSYYVNRIDTVNGPAMSYAIFCVQYARLGDADLAYTLFRRSFEPNLRAPFGVIAETATSMNPYFATGAGGLLQSVLCGFLGLQLTDEGIVQLPSVLPKHWKRVVATGIGRERATFERKQ